MARKKQKSTVHKPKLVTLFKLSTGFPDSYTDTIFWTDHLKKSIPDNLEVSNLKTVGILINSIERTIRCISVVSHKPKLNDLEVRCQLCGTLKEDLLQLSILISDGTIKKLLK